MLISKIAIGKPNYISGISYDIMKLEIYVNEVLPAEEAIVEAEKERAKYGNPQKTVAEIQRILKECLDTELVKLNASMTEFLEKCQKGETFAVQNLFTVLERYIVNKNLAKHLYLIKGKSGIEGAVSQEVREAKIKELEDKVAKAKAKRVKIRPLVRWDVEKKYVERWRLTATNYGNPVDAGGLWLNEENPMHKRLKVLYKNLKLADIPKNRMRQALVIGGKEYWVHPGHHYQGGNIL